MLNKSSVFISGLGVISKAGLSEFATLESLFEAKTANMSLALSSEMPVLSVPLPVAWRSELDLPPDFLDANVLAIKAVEQALENAQLDRERLSKLRVGVVFGSTVGCANPQPEFSREYFAGKNPDPAPFLKIWKYNTSQLLARHFDLRGPCLMLSNACTSGADAIAVGATWLHADLCDVVICGGTETILPQMYHGFRSLLLATPELCKPFDKDRRGLTLGEGAGVVVLEKTERMRSRAVLSGWGSASDAHHPTAPHPEARGLHEAVKQALAQASVSLEQIDFVNAHGTGTPHNDLAEGKWVRNHVPRARLVATKGYTGHTLASAGAIEAILTVLSLENQKLPASRGFEVLDEEIGLAPTTKIEEGKYQKALSFSLGFGGINTVLCLERAP